MSCLHSLFSHRPVSQGKTLVQTPQTLMGTGLLQLELLEAGVNRPERDES